MIAGSGMMLVIGLDAAVAAAVVDRVLFFSRSEL